MIAEYLKKIGLILWDRDLPTHRDRKTVMWVLVCAYVLFWLTLLVSPSRLLYDEPWYLGTVVQAKQLGPFSQDFITGLPGPAGPLYTWFHLFLSPVTELTPVSVRIATALALALAVGIVARLSIVPKEHRITVFLVGVTSQFAWILGGMALTEAPAMLCVAIAFYSWCSSSSAPRIGAQISYSIISGIALGLAVLGRQPYAFVGLAIGLASLYNRHRLFNVVVVAVFTITTIAPVFVIWKSFLPPLTASVSNGFHVKSFVMACGYAGIFILLVSPRFLVFHQRVLIVAAFVAMLNVAFGFVTYLPMVSVVKAVGGDSFVAVLRSVFGSVLVGTMVVVLTSCILRVWECRSHPVKSSAIMAVLFILICCGFIGHQFSSRYVGAALPFLVVTLAPFVNLGVGLSLRTSLASLLGLLSLLSYYEYV